MLNCKNASQLISQSLDRKLSFKQRWQLKFHLFICDACYRFNQQLYQLRAMLNKMRQQTEADVSITLSTEAKERIKEKINS
jgi:hypothetical protein